MTVGRLWLALIALACVGSNFSSGAAAELKFRPPQASSPLAIRIPSPMGRTGTKGAIRTVGELQITRLLLGRSDRW